MSIQQDPIHRSMITCKHEMTNVDLTKPSANQPHRVWYLVVSQHDKIKKSKSKRRKSKIYNKKNESHTVVINPWIYLWHQGTGTQCVAVFQRPRPYLYLWYPFGNTGGYLYLCSNPYSTMTAMNCQFMMFPPTKEELLRCWPWQKDRLIYLITSRQHAITVVLQFQLGPSYSNNNNNNHPTPQACFFLLLCCSGAVRLAPFCTVRIFMVSLKQFILYHNYCLKKQHMDLATCVLE